MSDDAVMVIRIFAGIFGYVMLVFGAGMIDPALTLVSGGLSLMAFAALTGRFLQPPRGGKE